MVWGNGAKELESKCAERVSELVKRAERCRGCYLLFLSSGSLGWRSTFDNSRNKGADVLDTTVIEDLLDLDEH